MRKLLTNLGLCITAFLIISCTVDHEEVYEESVSDNVENWTGVVTNGQGFVTGLNMIGSGIDQIPGLIKYLSSLEQLVLDHNNLTSLPSELSELSQLNFLSLRNNAINDLP